MTLPKARTDREYNKFVEDGSGNVAIRATIEGTTGDLTVNGDLTVTGSSNIGVDETVDGQLIIDSTDTEALLVRKDGDTGDVFVVDTTNSRVGIGVTSPNYSLDVQYSGDTYFRLYRTDTNATAGMRIKNTTNEWFCGLAYTAGGGKFEIRDVTNTATRMTIDTAGKVGIGTTSPNARCEILGSTGALFRVSNASGTIFNITSVGAYLDADNAVFAVGEDADYSIGYNSSTDNFEIVDGSTVGTDVRLVIDNSGKVGIGTETPANDLHLHGNGKWIEIDDTAGTNGVLLGITSGGAGQLNLYNNAGNRKVKLWGEESEDSYFNGGNLGIGTETPLSVLHIGNTDYGGLSDGLSFGDGDTGIYENADDNLAFAINGSRIWLMTGSILGSSGNTKHPILRYTQATATVPNFTPYDDIDTGIGTAGDDKLSLIAGGKNGLNVDGTGTSAIVGIGTTSPSTLLHTKAEGNNLLTMECGASSQAKVILTDGTNECHFGMYSDDTFRIVAGNALSNPHLTIIRTGEVGIGTTSPSTNADMTLEGGALCIKETTTPTADTNYGKIYTKTDNKLYFQDGAGTEHEISFV